VGNILGILGFLFGGSGLSIEELAKRLNTSVDILTSVPIIYSEFALKKRSGKKRLIYAPKAELCQMQKTINRLLLSKLKVHPCVKGFCRGQSIVTNAIEHVDKAVVIKFDIKDFFSNTKNERVLKYFKKIGWSSKAAKLLIKICCKNGVLPQGAPTSPTISNIVNYKLDAQLFGLAKANGFTYTRYADDLTFSSEDDNKKAISKLIRIVNLILPEFGYKLNKSKQFIARRHTRQFITGLVVNKKVQLPRETRRWLRAVEHSLKTTGKCTLSESQLLGWKSLQNMINLQGKN